ncbi:MAG: PEP/pyruvate-binding domain-containing protein, partial [Thermodesulfobacteriota bacterium]|nr:PEP/pyruvate-binding domain-containing protein [Thermodesulfobacteriota bacterium]
MAGKRKEKTEAGQKNANPPKTGTAKKDLTQKVVLTGADITQIGVEAEILVGGKNYNTAIISQVKGIRAPEFRAISSIAFHTVLDETKVNATLVRSIVNKEYNNTDWSDAEINKDPEFLKKFVR